MSGVHEQDEASDSTPLILHRHEMALDDSFKWSHPFEKRIGKLYPTAIHGEWQAWMRWWENAYIMTRLIKRFGADDVFRAVQCAQIVGRGSRRDEKAYRLVMQAIRRRDGYLSMADRPRAGRNDYHGLD